DPGRIRPTQVLRVENLGIIPRFSPIVTQGPGDSVQMYPGKLKGTYFLFHFIGMKLYQSFHCFKRITIQNYGVGSGVGCGIP
ncbi:MAG: hypothetical protein JXB88_22785, partial [Spirochaetales bacterium]|nr:hypothetical protein [Spirochaetales bacterium]